MKPASPPLGWKDLFHRYVVLMIVAWFLIGDGLGCKSDFFDSPSFLLDSKHHEVLFKNFQVRRESQIHRSTKNIKIGREDNLLPHQRHTLHLAKVTYFCNKFTSTGNELVIAFIYYMVIANF